MPAAEFRPAAGADRPSAEPPTVQGTDDGQASADGAGASKQQTRAVISCPTCLRQYEAPPAAKGKIGRCSRCEAHFAIALAEWQLPEGEPVVLDDPIVPRFAFFQDGCATFARNAIDLLTLAGEEVIISNILGIVVSLPRDLAETADEAWRKRYCNRILESAYDRNGDAGAAGQRRMAELLRYFLEEVPTRPYESVDMLAAAFQGVLAPVAMERWFPPALPSPGRRGGWRRWLERLAGRRCLRCWLQGRR